MWWVTVSLVLLWSSEVSAVDAPVHVSCKDANDGDVDWYVLYKAPAEHSVRTGLEYIYMDPNGDRDMSRIDDSNGVLAFTLRPMLRSVRNMVPVLMAKEYLVAMPPSFGFLSYSDQPPGASANTRLFGHSKGVVMGDSGSQTALWLTHSTPQFPFRRDQNRFWPDSGKDQGQSFLCVSLLFSELKTVGEHLQKIHMYPYDYDLPNTFPNELQNAAKWVTSQTQLGILRSLQTRSAKDLRTMAKPRGDEASDGDLYVKLAAGLGSDLEAQTWGCQPQRDESFCETGEKRVMNVEKISTGRITLGSWTTAKDHSKWAVTTGPAITWTCFGDVNRSPTQYQRWGGALCINDAQVNGLFKGFATEKLPCRKRPAPCISSDDMFGK